MLTSILFFIISALLTDMYGFYWGCTGFKFLKSIWNQIVPDCCLRHIWPEPVSLVLVLEIPVRTTKTDTNANK